MVLCHMSFQLVAFWVVYRLAMAGIFGGLIYPGAFSSGIVSAVIAN